MDNDKRSPRKNLSETRRMWNSAHEMNSTNTLRAMESGNYSDSTDNGVTLGSTTIGPTIFMRGSPTRSLRVAIILGTRPEIVKMSPIIRECQRLGLDFFILHTGQHYSYNMDRVFFEQLNLPSPQYNLDVGQSSEGTQAMKMLDGLEKTLIKESPDIVLVEGDTNTVLAGSVAASRLGIRVGHVEAGLRSYDRSMPEEMNRVLTDHCSDYLFAPTKNSRSILLGEGFPSEKIFVTGNTVVDALFQNLSLSKKRVDVLQDLGLESENYFVATIHRRENVDDEERLKGILNGLENVSKELGHEVVCPVHPRTRKNMETLGINSGCVKMIEPLDYLGFLRLEGEAKLVLTDSGGVQEEACILGVPCVTLRDNTERPETLEIGSNVLAGASPERILEKAKLMLGKDRNWLNPFGDGNAAVKIMDVLRRELE